MLWPELIKKTNAKGAKIDRIIEFIFIFRSWLLLFRLQFITQIVFICALIFDASLYTLPFFPNRKMHVIGVKIYIVALCWVGVTLVLPLLNANTWY
jgi:hypothetical protein